MVLETEIVLPSFKEDELSSESCACPCRAEEKLRWLGT